MEERNSTGICPSNALLEQCANFPCTPDALAAFNKSMGGQVWRVYALLLASVILAGVIVGMGAYGQRYRHHPFIRFIFLGATTLFLPVVSYLVSSIGTTSGDYTRVAIPGGNGFGDGLMAGCYQRFHPYMVLTSAFLVLLAAINTSVVAAVDDREGQNIGPPSDLLVQGIWACYLGANIHNYDIYFTIAPFALIFAKMVSKYYAFLKARRSFALGRNPRLIVGYMQQLQVNERAQHGEPDVGEDAPPPLLVMGEEGKRVEKQPHGYIFSNDSGTAVANNNMSLVTIDRVWQSGDSSDLLATSAPQVKYLCLSFAMFKLLRCRFARYELTNASSTGTFNFFWSFLLRDDKHDRTFGVIMDELSFIHDSYYSSLAISYSNLWLPFFNISVSLLSIGYCILAAVRIITGENYLGGYDKKNDPVIDCFIWCTRGPLKNDNAYSSFGNVYFDAVPVFLLLLLTMIAEVRDIASYIFSNWTKVALVCRCVKSASSPHSLRMQKWIIGYLLQSRCKLMKHWNDKMGQCSVLVLRRPRATSQFFVPRCRLFRLQANKQRSVKVPGAVKACIIRALRRCNSNGRRLSNGTASLRQSHVGSSFLWACNGKGTSDTILTWHIATCILEVRHPYGPYQQYQEEKGSPLISDKITATHLSWYCAYLVTSFPELLPDDDAWSNILYKDVSKDTERALASNTSARSSTPEEEYKKMVELLGANSKHEVVKNGVKLGKQLVETIDNEETAWKLLPDFWSEMILYVAPSDNLKGHSEAIARGGELITLLWTMLFHAGIVSRPGEDDGTTATTSAGAV